MKDALILGSILVILVLDFLALDDITTGNEPSLVGEYAYLLVSSVIIAVLFYIKFHKNKSR